MADMTTRSGGCQCGAVRFRAGALMDNPHVCHCRMCQKAVGNFFAALVGVKHADLTWTRGAPAGFRSSANVERGFCRDCGTPLYYRTLDGGHVSLCIAAFDDPAAIPLNFEFGMEGRLPQLDQLGGIPATPSADGDPDWAAELVRIAASSAQHPDRDTDAWPVR
jgi:hypothetical protein